MDEDKIILLSFLEHFGQTTVPFGDRFALPTTLLLRRKLLGKVKVRSGAQNGNLTEAADMYVSTLLGTHQSSEAKLEMLSACRLLERKGSD